MPVHVRVCASRPSSARNQRMFPRHGCFGAEGGHMVRSKTAALGAVMLVAMWLVPEAALAQNVGIAGVVKDASGAVLPGVTVEAASPALIEKVRTVVTNGEGLYSIVGLRPGTYSVTFTL